MTFIPHKCCFGSSLNHSVNVRLVYSVSYHNIHLQGHLCLLFRSFSVTSAEDVKPSPTQCNKMFQTLFLFATKARFIMNSISLHNLVMCFITLCSTFLSMLRIYLEKDPRQIDRTQDVIIFPRNKSKTWVEKSFLGFKVEREQHFKNAGILALRHFCMCLVCVCHSHFFSSFCQSHVMHRKERNTSWFALFL